MNIKTRTILFGVITVAAIAVMYFQNTVIEKYKSVSNINQQDIKELEGLVKGYQERCSYLMKMTTEYQSLTEKFLFENAYNLDIIYSYKRGIVHSKSVENLIRKRDRTDDSITLLLKNMAPTPKFDFPKQ